jgi:hypothetical protein
LGEFRDDCLKHLPERIDGVDRTQFSKEWLENIVTHIRPRIPDLKIHPVQLSSNADHLAFVLEIPQGATAHQATDHRYYRRYNFQSLPMLDHEIRDVMNRKERASILVEAEFVIWSRPDKEGHHGRLIFRIHNTSNVFVRYVALVASSPIRIEGKLIAYDDATMEETDKGSGYRLVFSNHGSAPLFPKGSISPWFEFRFLSRMVPEPEKQLDHFRFLAFADSMLPQRGTLAVEGMLRK